ncbi:unnamed protein product [Cylindrotheca closterium]|uniref:Altered inheritance of mitochondria protein 24, mitochondrial n=1 Tax=Cylindrotheca closterium TaxID=2856 RepID=A0AAD2PXL4_9STRA|nr:unnamed protein product [Cylindrotheca closterium]
MNGAAVRTTIQRGIGATARRQIFRQKRIPLTPQAPYQCRSLSSTPPSSSSSSSSVPAKTPEEEENLPAIPIDFQVAANIEGEESQIATITLRPGETLRAEAGAMLYMTQGIEMSTELHGASQAFSRMMTGQNVFLTEFRYHGQDSGTVGLGTDFPSKIVRLSLQDYPDSTIICQRGAYLASNPSIDIEMAYTKRLTTGFFGGQGFILQKLFGEGDVLVKAGGTLVTKDLEEGETLRATCGSIVGFTSTIDYDIEMMKGVKNVMFGGEGLFVATLKGPGRVWLQGMPPDRMIGEIARRVPAGGVGPFIPIPGMGGGGGGEAAGDADAGTAGDVAAGAAAGEALGDATPEEMVASTDAAIDADRQATVASSGVDSESPSALFGDAAGDDASNSTLGSTNTTEPASSSTFGDDSFASETSFADSGSNETTFGDEPMFTDDDATNFSASDDFGQSGEDFFGGDSSQTTTDVFDSVSESVDQDTGSGIISTLWDMFMGDD